MKTSNCLPTTIPAQHTPVWQHAPPSFIPSENTMCSYLPSHLLLPTSVVGGLSKDNPVGDTWTFAEARGTLKQCRSRWQWRSCCSRWVGDASETVDGVADSWTPNVNIRLSMHVQCCKTALSGISWSIRSTKCHHPTWGPVSAAPRSHLAQQDL